MTRTYDVAPADAADLDTAVDVMRARGLRASAARRLVLQALYATDDPLTAERIATGLDGTLPRSDLTSVYRNLERLEEIGLVRHFHLGHGPGLYARAGAARKEFLLCEACGSVRALGPGELDAVRATVREQFGHVARFTHFPLAGMCGDCAARAAEHELEE